MSKAVKGHQERQKSVTNPDLGPDEHIKVDTKATTEADRLSKQLKKYNIDPVWLQQQHTKLIEEGPSSSAVTQVSYEHSKLMQIVNGRLVKEEYLDFLNQ